MALKYYNIQIDIDEATPEKAEQRLREITDEILNEGVVDISGHADTGICDPPIPYTYACCRYKDYSEDNAGDYIRSILKRFPEDYNIIYKGWIKGSKEDRDKIIGFGVTGKIEYNHEENRFEQCEVTEEVMQKLIDEFPGFDPSLFTAFDGDTGKAFHWELQKYWGYRNHKG